MRVLIYHKDQWQYLACKDGSRTVSNKERAQEFSKKEAEKMEEEMKSLGFLTKVE